MKSNSLLNSTSQSHQINFNIKHMVANYGFDDKLKMFMIRFSC